MKTFGIFIAAILIPAAALADAVTSTGASFVSVPLTFQSTTGSNGGQGAPFWNNKSMDGTNMNGGDFLTGSNASLGLTDYLSSGAGFGNYLSTGSSGLDVPTNFNFVQSDTSVDVTLLYSNGGANYSANGTQIGLYNVDDPSQKLVLFAHGTLYNPTAGSYGVYNNDLTPQGTSTVNTFADYGVFAQTCGYNSNGTIYCDTYYSNAALDQTTESLHQHFALFQNAQDPQTYFLAFEDARGISPTEGYGDYNDVIFRLVTETSPLTTTTLDPVPEPATFSILGLGLLGLGLMRRSRSSIEREAN